GARARADVSATAPAWQAAGFAAGAKVLRAAAAELRANRDGYAGLITLEMGKLAREARAEVEKCALNCGFYAEHAERFLRDEPIETEARRSFVAYQPLGTVLAIMPWNFPFWQVFRFAAPALMAGNTALLKHASNVMMSASNIQKVFELAGFPENIFQNLVIKSDKVENIIKNPFVKAVTLTGSKPAGSAVASTAAKEIKKAVLELGGSNAFIVLEDADMEKAVETAIQARYQNTGQSCIAAKRLFLHKNIEAKFLEMFIDKVKNLASGNPINEDTYIGVLAREDLAIDLEKQVNDSVKMG